MKVIHHYLAPPKKVWPAIFWFVFFLLVPIAFVLIYSFSKRGLYGGVEITFQGASYLRAFEWIYLKIFWNSVWLAIWTSLSCFLIGFPIAYVMATSSKFWKNFLLTLVIIPFWTNFVVRAYAIKSLLGTFGPLNSILITLGLISEPISFSNTGFAVWLGMVTNYLPFMVLPLYVSLEKFDFSLLEAGRDLGAPSFKLIQKILLPLNLPGIITGFIFVFTPTLGEFVIPDILGGSKNMLIGNLITEQFLKTRDWPFGSALSILLIAMVMGSLLLYFKMGRKGAGK